MKNILITTDFSEYATNALDYITQLFQYESCKFYILHVVKASSFISDDLMNMKPSSSLYSQIIESEKIKLKSEINRVRGDYNNILHEFVPIVDYDNFIDSVNQCVDKNDIELVVMGTKGVTNNLKKILGSNTSHIIQNSKVPVMAIPNNYKFKPVHKLLFTTNYKYDYSINELQVLIDIAEHYDFEICVLHLTESETLTVEQQRVKTSLSNAFANISHDFFEVKSTDFLKTTQDFIINHNIDVFTMMNRKQRFFDKLFTY